MGSSCPNVIPTGLVALAVLAGALNASPDGTADPALGVLAEPARARPAPNSVAGHQSPPAATTIRCVDHWLPGTTRGGEQCPGGGTVYAVAAAPNGETGSYTATTLTS